MEEILEILKRIEEKIDTSENFYQLKGTVRKCDSLGRITLPANIRKNLEIVENTELKICEYNNCIILIPSK